MGHGTQARLVRTVQDEETNVLRSRSVQGKPVARRGRKARDLRNNWRPPGRRSKNERIDTTLGVDVVKANLARFTWALAIVASMALTLGAGIRWY